MPKHALFLVPLLLSSTAYADVDWKLYGGIPDAWCFYDASTVAIRLDNHIRVWTKCLSKKELDKIDIKKEYGGKILENAAQKIARYYIPPSAIIDTTINFDQALLITQYEETANTAYIQPDARIFYELNCSDRMMRELTIDLRTPKGDYSSTNKPGEWRYISPEGNGANLLKILCVTK